MRLTDQDRRARSRQAEAVRERLRESGAVAVAVTFVDTGGVARMKGVPVDRLPDLAAWGVGYSPAFDWFRPDDWVAAPEDGRGPVGDLRMHPDLDRVAELSAQPGWVWSPGERWTQDGEPHPVCSRIALRRLLDELATAGLSARVAFEIEWVVSRGEGAVFDPAGVGPAYGMTRVVELSDYLRDLLLALDAAGVTVRQLHPEYAPGQFELSVSAEDPVAAADTSVLARTVVRGVGQRHGLRSSFSPKVDAAGVGNGGHVHLSLWRDGRNLFAPGASAHGLGEEAGAFTGGVLTHLPALLTLGSPSVASYLRLVPQHWAGAYACWGVENREAALRMVVGPASLPEAANLEVKCFDLHANPYLAVLGVLAAGMDGLRAGTSLPDPISVDPASVPERELAAGGIERLPESLTAALAALLADEALTAALGQPLVESVRRVTESEIERFADATPEEVAEASRWTH
jgi:glutamine synthetase